MVIFRPLYLDYIRRGRSHGLGPLSIVEAVCYVHLNPYLRWVTAEELAFLILEGDGLWDVYGNGRVVLRLV